MKRVKKIWWLFKVTPVKVDVLFLIKFMIFLHFLSHGLQHENVETCLHLIDTSKYIYI